MIQQKDYKRKFIMAKQISMAVPRPIHRHPRLRIQPQPRFHPVRVTVYRHTESLVQEPMTVKDLWLLAKVCFTQNTHPMRPLMLVSFI